MGTFILAPAPFPGDHPWTWGGYVLFRDYDSYSLKLVDRNIIGVHVDFSKSERVNWEIKYDEFFKDSDFVPLFII